MFQSTCRADLQTRRLFHCQRSLFAGIVMAKNKGHSPAGETVGDIHGSPVAAGYRSRVGDVTKRASQHGLATAAWLAGSDWDARGHGAAGLGGHVLSKIGSRSSGSALSGGDGASHFVPRPYSSGRIGLRGSNSASTCASRAYSSLPSGGIGRHGSATAGGGAVALSSNFSPGYPHDTVTDQSGSSPVFAAEYAAAQSTHEAQRSVDLNHALSPISFASEFCSYRRTQGGVANSSSLPWRSPGGGPLFNVSEAAAPGRGIPPLHTQVSFLMYRFI